MAFNNRIKSVRPTSPHILGLFLFMAWLFVFTTPAGAETLKWRQSMHVIKADSIEVRDVPGHIVGLADVGGIASFENGEAAPVSLKGTYDYINGSGPTQGYIWYSFEDESTFVVKYQGVTTATPGTKISTFKGEITFTQGTGRFTGIKGNGSYTGKRFAPLSTGADFYYDFTATYSLPSK